MDVERNTDQPETDMNTPKIFKLYSISLKDAVYFRAFPTHVEHWGRKIEGRAHDTVELGRKTYRRYLDMGYVLARTIY